MATIFKKLIQREFGIGKYNEYFSLIKNELANTTDYHMPGAEVYIDMIMDLMESDVSAVKRRCDRLSETMIYAHKVNKGIKSVAVFYILCTVAVILFVDAWEICAAAVILLTAIFAYKLYEYMSNRNSFIDAHIILVYKRVLEKLLKEKQGGKNEDTI